MIQIFKIYKNLIDLSMSIRFNRNLEPANTVLQRGRASIRLEKEFVRNCKVRETFFMNNCRQLEQA